MNKKLEDDNFYVGSAKQASDFDTTKDFIINHIKKEYDYPYDISDSKEVRYESLQTKDRRCRQGTRSSSSMM